MYAAAAAAKSPQSCLTLCNPIDGSPPGSSVPGILQARTLEWVAISFSDAWQWKVKVKFLSHVRLFVTLMTVAYQAPPSMGFSRQEYWTGVPLPSPTFVTTKSNINMMKMFCIILLSCLILFQYSSVQSPSCVPHFVTTWTATLQASLSIANSPNLLKLMSVELVMPSSHLILCLSLLLPPSIFASISVFSNELVFCFRRPKY